MRIVTGLQTATPPVTAPAAPGGADEPGVPPAQG